jgi:hypothetical protein
VSGSEAGQFMHLNSIDALARRKNPEGVELIATVSTRLLPQKSAALMCTSALAASARPA